MSVGTFHYLYCDSCGEEADVHDRSVRIVKEQARREGYVRMSSGMDLCAKCFKEQSEALEVP